MAEGDVTAVESYSWAEEQFNRRRRTAGLVLGPALFLAMLWLPMPALTAEAHRLAAVLVFVIVYWVSEALPLPVTAVAGPVLAIVLQVGSARQVLAPFADPIIFLFMGSFMLAEAMYTHGLDRRIAFQALAMPGVGRSPVSVLVVFGAVSMGLSMWLSNTATTAMMFPIAMSIIGHLKSAQPNARAVEPFALSLMLITAFGSSIGGMATPVGTPPNLIGIGLLERATGFHISFFRWMIIGVPLALIMFAFQAVYFRLISLRRGRLAMGDATGAVEELRRLGPLTRAQRNVLVAFGLTVALWIAPGVLAIAGLDSTSWAVTFNTSVPEAVAAMTGAILLFVLPIDWRERRFTLTWTEAVRIDWGIILLFGGGLALGSLTFSTGLAEALGRGILAWIPTHTSLVLTMLFTAVAILITETASNTASATMVVPIAIAVAGAAGVSPLQPALGATLGASMAFMMPVSTPPNAIVYSSGHVPITAMIRHGVVLDAFGYVVVVALVMSLGGFLG
jgi:sodium-dependent dicarboxylate transporter 2/3/5